MSDMDVHKLETNWSTVWALQASGSPTAEQESLFTINIPNEEKLLGIIDLLYSIEVKGHRYNTCTDANMQKLPNKWGKL
jgi:hypothetical protein